MNTKLALALASSAATAALILSCSDDSPGDADAAVWTVLPPSRLSRDG
ncbi:MAG: hypothetical protein HS111_28835 [Kofleriaceae bacterium]|nr:hypothetical protein [Kofleriaceae bacterium]